MNRGAVLSAELHLDGYEAAVELLALVDVEIDLKTREAIKKPPT